MKFNLTDKEKELIKKYFQLKEELNELESQIKQLKDAFKDSDEKTVLLTYGDDVIARIVRVESTTYDFNAIPKDIKERIKKKVVQYRLTR